MTPNPEFGVSNLIIISECEHSPLASWEESKKRGWEWWILEVKWSLPGTSIILYVRCDSCVSTAHVCVFLLCVCQCMNLLAGRHCGVQRGVRLCKMLSAQWWGSASVSSSLTADILQSAAQWTDSNKQDTSPGMLIRHVPWLSLDWVCAVLIHARLDNGLVGWAVSVCNHLKDKGFSTWMNFGLYSSYIGPYNSI